MNNKIVTTIILSIVGGMAAGWSVYHYQTSDGPTSTSSLTLQKAENTDQWSVYADVDRGFAIKYPSGWTYQVFPHTVNFSKKSVLSGLNSGPLNFTGQDLISISIAPSSESTFSEIDRGTKYKDGVNRFESTIDGVKAIRILSYDTGQEGEHGYTDRTQFFSSNNTYYSIDTIYVNDKSDFQKKGAVISGMLSTFRFIDASQIKDPYAAMTASEIAELNCDNQSGETDIRGLKVANSDLCNQKKIANTLEDNCRSSSECLEGKMSTVKEYLCDQGIKERVIHSCVESMFSYESADEINNLKNIQKIQTKETKIYTEGQHLPELYKDLEVRDGRIHHPENVSGPDGVKQIGWNITDCEDLKHIRNVNGVSGFIVPGKFMSVESCEQVPQGVKVIINYYTIS